MFVSKKLSQSKWKQRVVGLVGNTISSADQAVSGWFWNLINNLPRDYLPKRLIKSIILIKEFGKECLG